MKILISFWTLIVLSGTAFATSSIPADTCKCECNLIHYTDKQDINCLICLQNYPLLDSNLKDRESQILVLKDELDNMGDRLQIAQSLVNAQANEIQRKAKKIKWLSIGFYSALGVAVIEGLIIILLK